MSKKQSKAARRKGQAAVGRQGGAEQRPISEAAAPQPTIPVRQSPQAPSPALDRKALLWFLIPAVLLFLFLAFQGGGDDRVLAIVAAIALVACSVGKTPIANIAQRLSIPALVVCAYLLLNAAAGLYSKFGSFAAPKFGKILASFCIFAILLFRVKQGCGRQVAAVLATLTAAFSLISIDAASLKLLSGVYIRILDALGCSYGSMSTGYEAGIRITGIFGNPNVLAGILAFGVFLGLYLVLTAKSRRGLLGCALLLEVNALGFLLAFSMGAIGMFLVSVAIYLIFEARDRRLPLLVLMLETAIIGVVIAFPSFAGLGSSGGAAWLPVLAGPLGGVLLWLLHGWLGVRLGEALNQRPRLALGAAVGVVLLAVGYVLLAFNVTGPYQLQPGEILRRSVYPSGGEYRLEGDWSGEVMVTVESQNDSQTIMHTSTMLYQGGLAEAVFTVPEDSKVVYLNFISPQGAVLDQVSLSGGEQVKLGYRFLPGFAANRIQGLWANQNAIQRTEFFRDGLRIWQKSPVIGNGLGSVEGLVTSVQQFYYESRYVHNHYIQLLAEMGLPGLLCFLAVIGAAAVTLLKRRREGEGDPLLAALAACLAMMSLHAAAEAVWSISVYQTFALSVLALLCVVYGQPVAKLTGKGIAWIFSLLLWGVTLIFAWFLGGNLSAELEYSQVKAGTRQQTPYTMTQLARKDHYNWAQYKLDMAVNACDSEVPEFAETAATYAIQVRELGIYSINYSLSAYFYSTLGQWDQFFAATREGISQAASRASAWQEIFFLYEGFFPGEEAENAAWYAQQVLMFYDMLQQYNDGRMEQITLVDQNMTFIQHMQHLAGVRQ